MQVAIQTPTNLNQYTYYYWRVDVSDGKATTEGDLQTRVRTYCQGIGYTCNGPFVSTTACPVTHDTENGEVGITCRKYK